MRTLVMRAALGNLLRAWTQAGDRHQHFHRDARLAVNSFADQRDVVIEQALHPGHWCGLVHEIRKTHFDVSGLRFQTRHHFFQDTFERLDRYLALMLVEYLDEARHVRALEVVRQMHIHVESGDSVLNADTLVFDLHRVAYAFDADAIDRQVTRISRTLHIGNKILYGSIHNCH